MPTASGSIAYLGAARFQGFWNAATNEATGSGLDGAAPYHPDVGAVDPGDGYTTLLIDGGYHATTNLTASAGDYWQVTGSGTTSINGQSSWALNDWVIYSGSAGSDAGSWKKLSYQDTIASIVLGKMDGSAFHMGTANDKHVIFASGSEHSGSADFTYNYGGPSDGNTSPHNALLLTGSLNVTGSAVFNSVADTTHNAVHVTGSLGVKGMVRAFMFINPSSITEDITVPPGHNAVLYGPITVASGKTLTVTDGATLKIIDA